MEEKTRKGRGKKEGKDGLYRNGSKAREKRKNERTMKKSGNKRIGKVRK